MPDTQNIINRLFLLSISNNIEVDVILLNWINENILTIVGWLLSIISIIIALYQYSDKKRYENAIKTNIWMLYQRVNNLGGTVQKAMIEAEDSNIEKTLFEKMIRSDTLAAELNKEAIRLIMISEKNITVEIIDKWESEGKITSGYAKLFKNYLS